jgi:hypothetical protein
MADSPEILFNRSGASPVQRLKHRLGMGFGDAEEGAGGAFGAAVADQGGAAFCCPATPAISRSLSGSRMPPLLASLPVKVPADRGVLF